MFWKGMVCMRKHLNFTDESVLQKLNSVENQSKYVQDLILKDIATQSSDNAFDAGVLKSLDMMEAFLNVIQETLVSGDSAMSNNNDYKCMHF